MTEITERLARAARQLIQTENLIGGEFIPAVRNPLPPIEASPPGGADMNREELTAALVALDTDEVRNCQRCALCKGRTNTVLGEGDCDADLVFVGEAPGHDEDISGRPFVGRAGELLTRMISAMGLSRQDIYICNLVKCRPPNNRAPGPDEIQACWDYLIRQLQILRPKVIVTLGNPATQNLLDTRTGITKLRGQWQELPDIGDGLEGIAVMPTFHPAYVLRQYTPDVRGKVWSDLQQVMELLGLQGPENGKQ